MSCACIGSLEKMNILCVKYAKDLAVLTVFPGFRFDCALETVARHIKYWTSQNRTKHFFERIDIASGHEVEYVCSMLSLSDNMKEELLAETEDEPLHKKQRSV